MITQKAIKHVLRERWYAWEDAREIFETNKQTILDNEDPDLKTSRLLNVKLGDKRFKPKRITSKKPKDEVVEEEE